MADGLDMPISDHEVTCSDLKAWYHSVFKKFGMMVLAYHDQHPGHRLKVLGYAGSIYRLHQALDQKIDVTSDPDRLRDLKIMHSKLTTFRDIVWADLEIHNEELLDRLRDMAAPALARSRMGSFPSGRQLDASRSQVGPMPGSSRTPTDMMTSRYSSQPPGAPMSSRTAPSRAAGIADGLSQNLF